MFAGSGLNKQAYPCRAGGAFGLLAASSIFLQETVDQIYSGRCITPVTPKEKGENNHIVVSVAIIKVIV